MILPCQHRHIRPFGGELLAACTDKRGPVAARLIDLPVTKMWMDGADGVNVKFHARHFREAAVIMKPRRLSGRRQLPPAERDRLVEAGSTYRFAAGLIRGSDDRRRTHGGKAIFWSSKRRKRDTGRSRDRMSADAERTWFTLEAMCHGEMPEVQNA